MRLGTELRSDLIMSRTSSSDISGKSEVELDRGLELELELDLALDLEDLNQYNKSAGDRNDHDNANTTSHHITSRTQTYHEQDNTHTDT